MSGEGLLMPTASSRLLLLENARKFAKNPIWRLWIKAELILINMLSPTFVPNLVTLAWKMSSGMPKEVGSLNGPLSVLEIPTGPPVRGRQLWRRTGNFLLIFLWFYVYDLRLKTWGPTTFLTEFPTLPLCAYLMRQNLHDRTCLRS